MNVDELTDDRLGDRLCRVGTPQLLARRVEMKPFRSFANAQDDARLTGGLSCRGPLQAVELSRR